MLIPTCFCHAIPHALLRHRIEWSASVKPELRPNPAGKGNPEPSTCEGRRAVNTAALLSTLTEMR